MKYVTIVADPPWNVAAVPTHLGGRLSLGRGRSSQTKLPYPSMAVDDIKALDISGLAATNCRLFLWTVNSYLPASFDVMDAWGFRYRQMLVWHKTGTPSPFVTHIAPNHAEYLLVGVRGKPGRLESFKSSVVAVPSRQGGGGRAHSTKPDVFLDLIEAASPGPYLELFARRNRMGWDTWGNEALGHVEVAS